MYVVNNNTYIYNIYIMCVICCYQQCRHARNKHGYETSERYRTYKPMHFEFILFVSIISNKTSTLKMQIFS